MCFYEKSKMVTSSHGSRRLTAEEVLEEVFADRDSEFSDEESEDGFEYTVLCKSNANDNQRISRFVLAIFRRYIRETSHGLVNVKTINQRDIGTIFVISRQDIVLATLRYNDISQSKTINRHNISLQRSSL